MEWYDAVDIIRKYVFRISTPRGSGTGFLISNTDRHTICGVATAAHVIDHAHYWEEPIRIDHADSGKFVIVRHAQRAVFLDSNRDTAAIIFERGDMELPTEMLILAPKEKHLRVGNEIGWLGFPAIPGASLCFFGGKISAWLQSQEAYLVDGVTINGVSGGPAFHHVTIENNQPIIAIIGVVSAYMPNRATGEVLPGLGVIRGITQFHELAPTFASIDQAKTKETQPIEPPQKPESDAGGQSTFKRTT